MPRKTRVLTIPALPRPKKPGARTSDPKYIQGQRLLADAIKYLAQHDPDRNKDAVNLLSEHFRSNFRMDDRPVA
jgi:hypothetical protein